MLADIFSCWSFLFLKNAKHFASAARQGDLTDTPAVLHAFSCRVTPYNSFYFSPSLFFPLSFSLWPSPGRPAREAHPVDAAPSQAAGVCAQLCTATAVEDQDREPCPGHGPYLLCESSVAEQSHRKIPFPKTLTVHFLTSPSAALLSVVDHYKKYVKWYECAKGDPFFFFLFLHSARGFPMVWSLTCALIQWPWATSIYEAVGGKQAKHLISLNWWYLICIYTQTS